MLLKSLSRLHPYGSFKQSGPPNTGIASRRSPIGPPQFIETLILHTVPSFGSIPPCQASHTSWNVSTCSALFHRVFGRRCKPRASKSPSERIPKSSVTWVLIKYGLIHTWTSSAPKIVHFGTKAVIWVTLQVLVFPDKGLLEALGREGILRTAHGILALMLARALSVFIEPNTTPGPKWLFL